MLLGLEFDDLVVDDGRGGGGLLNRRARRFSFSSGVKSGWEGRLIGMDGVEFGVMKAGVDAACLSLEWMPRSTT